MTVTTPAVRCVWLVHGRQGDCPRQPQALRPDDRRNQLLLRRRIALGPGQPLNGATATSLKLTAISGIAGANARILGRSGAA